jgi:hypothetical protein
VRYVYIDGELVSTENRQTRFYKKYQERLERSQEEEKGSK